MQTAATGEHARLTVCHCEVFVEPARGVLPAARRQSPDGTGGPPVVRVKGRAVQGSTRIWPGQRITLGEVEITLRRVRSTAGAEESVAPQAAVVRELLPPELLGGRKYDLGEVVAQGGDAYGGLAYLAHVLRCQPNDRATAERLLSALRDRSHLRPLLDLPRQERAIQSLQWSPDGTLLLISNVFSPDGAYHVIGRADGQMLMWETKTWEWMQVLGDLQTFTAAPAFSPDSRRLYFTKAGTITGIEAQSLQPLAWTIEPAAALVASAVHPHGHELAGATADRRVRFYDAVDGRARPGALVHTREVVTLEYSADGARIVTRTDPSGVELWDAFGHRPLAARCPVRGDITDFSLDRRGERFAVATSDGSVRVWQVAPGEALPVILPVRADAERPASESVILHPNGRHFAKLSRQTAQVWDWATGERVGPLLNHEQWICSAAFTPRGDRLLTGGSEDKQVRVWDYHAGREVGPRMNSLGYLWNIRFPASGGDPRAAQPQRRGCGSMAARGGVRARGCHAPAPPRPGARPSERPRGSGGGARRVYPAGGRECV